MTTSRELDKLVQKACENQQCRVCRKSPCVGHHVTRRREKMLRWDILNILPVCPEHHRMIHDGKIKEQDLLPEEIWNYLQEVKNKDYRTFLLEIGMTEKEYLEDCKHKLLEFI